MKISFSFVLFDKPRRCSKIFHHFRLCLWIWSRHRSKHCDSNENFHVKFVFFEQTFFVFVASLSFEDDGIFPINYQGFDPRKKQNVCSLTNRALRLLCLLLFLVKTNDFVVVHSTRFLRGKNAFESKRFVDK